MADKRSTDTAADAQDEREIPLDIRDTRGQPGPDEEKMGFQNVEGPGAEEPEASDEPASSKLRDGPKTPVPR